MQSWHPLMCNNQCDYGWWQCSFRWQQQVAMTSAQMGMVELGLHHKSQPSRCACWCLALMVDTLSHQSNILNRSSHTHLHYYKYVCMYKCCITLHYPYINIYMYVHQRTIQKFILKQPIRFELPNILQTMPNHHPPT